MTKRRKRFLVDCPDDVTDLIVAHPGGHIDLIEVDHGDQDNDDVVEQPADDTDDADSFQREDEPAGRRWRGR